MYTPSQTTPSVNQAGLPGLRSRIMYEITSSRPSMKSAQSIDWHWLNRVRYHRGLISHPPRRIPSNCSTRLLSVTDTAPTIAAIVVPLEEKTMQQERHPLQICRKSMVPIVTLLQYFIACNSVLAILTFAPLLPPRRHHCFSISAVHLAQAKCVNKSVDQCRNVQAMAEVRQSPLAISF